VLWATFCVWLAPQGDTPDLGHRPALFAPMEHFPTHLASSIALLALQAPTQQGDMQSVFPVLQGNLAQPRANRCVPLAPQALCHQIQARASVPNARQASSVLLPLVGPLVRLVLGGFTVPLLVLLVAKSVVGPVIPIRLQLRNAIVYGYFLIIISSDSSVECFL
jgi:hypothetical protein